MEARAAAAAAAAQAAKGGVSSKHKHAIVGREVSYEHFVNTLIHDIRSGEKWSNVFLRSITRIHKYLHAYNALIFFISSLFGTINNSKLDGIVDLSRNIMKYVCGHILWFNSYIWLDWRTRSELPGRSWWTMLCGKCTTNAWTNICLCRNTTP